MSLTQLTDCAVSSNFGTRLDSTEAAWQGQLVLCDQREGWRVAGGGKSQEQPPLLAYLLHYWAPEARTSAACLSRLLMLIQLTRALTVANCDRIFHQFPTQLGVFCRVLERLKDILCAPWAMLAGYPLILMIAAADLTDTPSYFNKRSKFQEAPQKLFQQKLQATQCLSIILKWVSRVYCFPHIAYRF